MNRLTTLLRAAVLAALCLFLAGCDDVAVYGSVGYSSYSGYGPGYGAYPGYGGYGYGSSISVGGRLY
jgi:hypothetical protein